MQIASSSASEPRSDLYRKCLFLCAKSVTRGDPSGFATFCIVFSSRFVANRAIFARVKTKKPVELEEDPAVPEALRWGLARLLLGARYVAVKEAHANGKSYKALNGFQLRYRKDDKPEDSIDDIALTACRIMHERWLEKNMSDEGEANLPIAFRIELQAPDNPKSTRPYMDWTWDPDDDSDTQDDHMRSLEQMVLRDLLDQTQQDKDRDRIYIADMQDRFLRQCELNTEPIKQTGNQLAFANALSLQGMQALVTAAQLTYSHEQQKALEDARTARWKMVIDNIGPLGKIAAAQLMGFIGNKMTGQNVKIPRGAGPSASDHPPGAPSDPPGAASDPTEEFEAPDADPETSEEVFDEDNPIASVAETFGDSITVRQRKHLRTILDPAQIGLIDSLAESDDDDGAVAAYEKLADALSDMQLLQLAAQLDADQGQLFEMLRKLVAKAQAPDDEDGEDGEDGDGDG
jgi:hypothetical protein